MGSSFHSTVCLDIQLPNSTKGFKVMMSIKCWWHIFMAIVLLWSKLLYIVPMFQSTFTSALFLSLYWCVVAHPSWLKNERKSSGCVPILSCINTVFPESREGVCSFILEQERLKMHPSQTHCSQFWFSSSWQSKASHGRKVQYKKKFFHVKTFLFHCENTNSHWYLLL